MDPKHYGVALAPLGLILFGLLALGIKLLIARLPKSRLRDAILKERFVTRYSAHREIVSKAVDDADRKS
jgi:hypothetical protein